MAAIAAHLRISRFKALFLEKVSSRLRQFQSQAVQLIARKRHNNSIRGVKGDLAQVTLIHANFSKDRRDKICTSDIIFDQ